MPDPPPHECMGSIEAVVTHGANTICHVPRAEAWHPTTWEVAALVVSVGLGAWTLTRARHPRRALGLALALAALPGLWQLAVHRADAPPRRPAAVATLRALHDAVARYTPAAGCVHRARIDCEACVPLVRFALVAPTCRTMAAVVIEPGALGGACWTTPGTLRCGPAPGVRR